MLNMSRSKKKKKSQSKEIKKFFELPESSVRGIPLVASEKGVDFGLVEVGCKPTRKRGVLRDRRQLFYKIMKLNSGEYIQVPSHHYPVEYHYA